MALYTNATHHGGETDKPRVRIRGVGGSPFIAYQYLDRNDAYRHATVLVTLDHLRVFMFYDRLEKSHLVTVDELREILKESEIVYGIDEGSLDMLAMLVNEGHSDTMYFLQVAVGLFPRPGMDEHLEFTVPPTSRKPRYEQDESGNIDYRELNLVKSARKGQCVAVLREPGKGVPGMNVCGKKIVAPDGEPVSVRAGSGIRMSDDGRKFYAEEDGRIEYESNVLTMVSDYRVSGDVDFKVGNIDFIGEIEISGSVLDDFCVIGHRTVQIHGSVGNCRIEADGDLTIGGGVSGKGTGTIRTGGALRARYLNEVSVQAENDVIVQKEILNTTLRTRGQVIIPQGTILSGRVVCLKGIEAEAVGSPLGTQTEIVAGVDFNSEEQLAVVNAKIVKLESEIVLVSQRLRPLLEEKAIVSQMSSEKRESLVTVLAELRGLKQYLSELEEEREKLAGVELADKNVRVNILKRLFPGTVVKFPGLEARFKEQMRGPISIVPDMRRKAVRIVEYRPLGHPTLS